MLCVCVFTTMMRLLLLLFYFFLVSDYNSVCFPFTNGMRMVIVFHQVEESEPTKKITTTQTAHGEIYKFFGRINWMERGKHREWSRYPNTHRHTLVHARTHTHRLNMSNEYSCSQRTKTYTNIVVCFFCRFWNFWWLSMRHTHNTDYRD